MLDIVVRLQLVGNRIRGDGHARRATGLLSMNAFLAPTDLDSTPINSGIGRKILRATPDHISISTGAHNGAMPGL